MNRELMSTLALVGRCVRIGVSQRLFAMRSEAELCHCSCA
jgi:hypothetical protein